MLFLLLDSSPLASVSSAIFNVESSCVPVKTLCVSEGVQSLSEIVVFEEDLLSLSQLAIFVDRFLLRCNALDLDEFFKSSSCNGTFGPFVEVFDIVPTKSFLSGLGTGAAGTFPDDFLALIILPAEFFEVLIF